MLDVDVLEQGLETFEVNGESNVSTFSVFKHEDEVFFAYGDRNLLIVNSKGDIVKTIGIGDEIRNIAIFKGLDDQYLLISTYNVVAVVSTSTFAVRNFGRINNYVYDCVQISQFHFIATSQGFNIWDIRNGLKYIGVTSQTYHFRAQLSKCKPDYVFFLVSKLLKVYDWKKKLMIEDYKISTMKEDETIGGAGWDLVTFQNFQYTPQSRYEHFVTRRSFVGVYRIDHEKKTVVQVLKTDYKAVCGGRFFRKNVYVHNKQYLFFFEEMAGRYNDYEETKLFPMTTTKFSASAASLTPRQSEKSKINVQLCTRHFSTYEFVECGKKVTLLAFMGSPRQFNSERSKISWMKIISPRHQTSIHEEEDMIERKAFLLDESMSEMFCMIQVKISSVSFHVCRVFLY